MAVDRAHAQQGQSVRLGMRFSLGGSAVDPFEVRQVEVLDAQFAVLATFATTVHDGTGLFHVDWPVPADEPPTIHYDRWFATASSGGTEEVFTNSFQVLTAEASTAGTPYMTTDEARSIYLPEATEITDAQLAEMVLLAQETIEWVAGQVFLPVFETRTFNGSGKAALSIARPIQSITSINVLGCNGSTGSTSTIDPASVRISRGRCLLGLGNMQRFGHLLGDALAGVPPWHGLGVGCGVWPAGFMNIEITGTWGAFAQVPRQIRHALGLLLQHAAVCDSPSGAMDSPYESESIAGDRTYVLRKIWTQARTSNGTGFPEVDAILARFNAGVIVGVV